MTAWFIIGVVVGATAGFLLAVYLIRIRRREIVSEHNVWSIGIQARRSPLDANALRAVANPVLTADDVTDVRAGFVADPFIVRDADSWHMFLEVWDTAARRGVIARASSADGLSWRYEKVVLREPFHLSYPSVIQWRGEYYMIPETVHAQELRVYRAAAFPDVWELAATPARGLFVDPTIFEHDGRLWMFAQTNPRAEDRLGLFVAEDLFGPWREHPMSPVVSGNARHARPAGAVIRFDGRLFRVAQDCHRFYGREVNAFEILELTPSAYRERAVSGNPVLAPGGGRWNRDGMHTLNAVEADGGTWLAAVDGHVTRFRLKLPRAGAE